MFNRVEAKLLAKQQIKENILTLLLIALITSAIAGACAGIFVVGWVASFVVMPSLMLGLTMIYLNLAKGVSVDIARMFDGFQNVGPCVILFLLTALYTFLWKLLFIIPGIIKGLSYSMGMYILAEHPEMSATQALDESKRMMRGHKWELFVLQLSFIGWFLLVPFTMGLLLIWLTPYVKMSTTNFYNCIKPIETVENKANAYGNSYYA